MALFNPQYLEGQMPVASVADLTKGFDTSQRQVEDIIGNLDSLPVETQNRLLLAQANNQLIPDNAQTQLSTNALARDNNQYAMKLNPYTSEYNIASTQANTSLIPDITDARRAQANITSQTAPNLVAAENAKNSNIANIAPLELEYKQQLYNNVLQNGGKLSGTPTSTNIVNKDGTVDYSALSTTDTLNAYNNNKPVNMSKMIALPGANGPDWRIDPNQAAIQRNNNERNETVAKTFDQQATTGTLSDDAIRKFYLAQANYHLSSNPDVQKAEVARINNLSNDDVRKEVGTAFPMVGQTIAKNDQNSVPVSVNGQTVRVSNKIANDVTDKFDKTLASNGTDIRKNLETEPFYAKAVNMTEAAMSGSTGVGQVLAAGEAYRAATGGVLTKSESDALINSVGLTGKAEQLWQQYVEGKGKLIPAQLADLKQALVTAHDAQADDVNKRLDSIAKGQSVKNDPVRNQILQDHVDSLKLPKLGGSASTSTSGSSVDDDPVLKAAAKRGVIRTSDASTPTATIPNILGDSSVPDMTSLA